MPCATECGRHAARPARAALLALVAVVMLAGLVGAIVYIVRQSPPKDALAGTPAAPSGDGASTIQQALDSAKVYINEGKFTEAGLILDRAIQKFPQDQELHLRYAEALQWQKRWRDAYDQFAAAIAIGPDLPQVHFDAGTVANAAGLLERAEHHYSMAQSKDATDARYPLYLAMIQVKLSKDTEAMASLLRVVRLQPDLAAAWGTMAELDLRGNNLALAQQHIAKARQLQPDLLKWRLVEARTLNRSGEPEKALTLLAALEPAQRRDNAVLALMAESYGLLKRPADAAAMYAEVAAAKPADAELRYLAATWYQRAGDTARARDNARAAAALGHVQARQLLETLK